MERFRAYQRAVSDSLVRAIEGAGMPFAVLLSSLGANHPRGRGPVVALHELEGTLRTIPELSVLSLRAGFFMENFLMNVDLVRSAGIPGSPAPAHAPMSVIAAATRVRYAARGAAQGLLEPEAGTAVVRSETPLSEFAKVFAAAYAGAVAA